MKKLKSTLPNMILSLGIIGIVAGGLLGGMYAITKEPIEKAEKNQLTESIAEVTPPFTNSPEDDKTTIKVDGKDFMVFPAMEGDRLAGAAVLGYTMEGFSGEVAVLCGFDAEGNVKDYRVIRHAETPGLGAKMEEWFHDPTGARSVIGKNPSVESFYVTKDKANGGQIDAITAATISSRAFLGVMRQAYTAYREYAAGKGIELAAAK
ncbi:MAG: RnfABCDGE type electron transport complex subunit G [Muribaculaceae bacterium]|nr:RnfABCDGE type electron transport complex subunit G [Muribaculaceae bacterium]